MLKNKLRKIKENKWNFDDVSIYKEMINYIGSTDSELRDELIYTGFYHLIDNNLISDNEVLKLLDEVSTLMFKGIETKDDRVFTRAFSTLIINLIIKHDIKYNIISKERFEKLYDDIYFYIQKETNFIGYDKEKGWAHALAHFSDLAYSFSQNIKATNFQRINLAYSLIDSYMANDYVFIHFEDERCITLIVDLISKDIMNLNDILVRIKTKDTKSNEILTNKKTFLSTLYFRLKNIDHPRVDNIITMIKELFNYFYE